MDDATDLLPYLRALGVSDAYLSPILDAEPGSAHGYDVTDPSCVRAEIGGDTAFSSLRTALRRNGLGLLLDIVPNHMAASARNPWWSDLLQFGGDSPFTTWFDLSWNSVEPRDRLHLPLLSDELADAAASGHITLSADEQGLGFRYFEQRLPLSPFTYAQALRLSTDVGRPPRALDELPESVRRRAAAIIGSLDRLEPCATLVQPANPDRRAQALAARQGFTDLFLESAPFRAWAAQRLTRTGSDTAALKALLERQVYRLRPWQTAVREITYRRFFDITTLAGVRVEDADVFAQTHALFREWSAAGDLTGLRVDHVDGLHDPAAYLHRLRETAPVYTVVEKILGEDEALRDWECEGTTGYDFLNVVNGWFIESAGWRALVAEYTRATGEVAAFREIAYQRKMLVLNRLFGGERAALRRELRATGMFGGIEDDALDGALRELTAALSVYRTYVTERGIATEDRARIMAALAQARGRAPALPAAAFDGLRDVLLLDGPVDARRDAALRFIMHWQQFTGPVMAKGIEDVALYNYFPLASANEVGADPGAPHTTTERLHAFFAMRQQTAPASLNATSTHDTKRSEDVRARLNVLSELTSAWSSLLHAWIASADAHPDDVLDPVADVLLLQTLLGSWPLDGEPDPAYASRIRDYMRKAAREARRNTSWRDPNELYEGRLADRVAAFLEGAGDAPLRSQLRELAHTMAFPGALTALAQVILKTTAPGVPDFYQGTELWCLSLVDPDNRRPVDFAHRARLLNEIEPLLASASAEAVSGLLRTWQDGRVKLFVTAGALRHRAGHRALFDSGSYLPLEITGPRATHVAAFARRHARQWSLTVVSRWLAHAVPTPGMAPPGEFWASTRLVMPAEAPRRWRNVLTGESVEADDDGGLEIAAIFAVLPSAILYGVD